MSSTYPEGPWESPPNQSQYCNVRALHGADGKRFANIQFGGGEREMSEEEIEAAALKIAAAPELLELAKVGEKHLRREFMSLANTYAGTPYENDPAYKQAERLYREAAALIAKATGTKAG